MSIFTGSIDTGLPDRVQMPRLTAEVAAAVGFEVGIVGAIDAETMRYKLFRWEYEADADVNDKIVAAIQAHSLGAHEDDDFQAVEKAQAAAEDAKLTAADIPAQIAALAARVTALEAKAK